MLRNLFCVFVAIVWTAVCFPLCVLAMIVRMDASASMWWVKRAWSPVLLWAGGARLEVTGLDLVDPKRPAIYVSNHQSTIDIPVLFVAIPVDFRFVAKKSLQFVPFIGWYMTLARYIFIDRGNHRAAIASLDKAAHRIRGGVSIVVFPEGTRSERRVVIPFKKGSFALAMKAGVPIHPVTIEGSGLLMPKNSWNITPGPIRVRVGEAIEPAPFGDDREALMRAVREVIIAQSLEMGGLGGERKNTEDSKATEQGEQSSSAGEPA